MKLKAEHTGCAKGDNERERLMEKSCCSVCRMKSAVGTSISPNLEGPCGFPPKAIGSHGRLIIKRVTQLNICY